MCIATPLISAVKLAVFKTRLAGLETNAGEVLTGEDFGSAFSLRHACVVQRHVYAALEAAFEIKLRFTMAKKVEWALRQLIQ